MDTNRIGAMGACEVEAWQPGVSIDGDTNYLKVSATDAQDRPSGCGVHGAVKVRPAVKASNWQRRFDNSYHFTLGALREIACKVHDDPRIESWEGLSQAIQDRLKRYQLHPGVSSYASQAIENYVEAHEVITGEVGNLKFRYFDPQISASGRCLTVWAPLYESEAGVREIRRLRFGSAQTLSARNERWTHAAAFIAASIRSPQAVTRVRVVEIGLKDGSHEVVFDGDPEKAKAEYKRTTLGEVTKIIGATHMAPGYACGNCKLAGACHKLDPLNGFLGQKQPGVCTRSVSAQDIETHNVCPAQWYLTFQANLPRENSWGVASERGRLIHLWMATAHSRSTPCSIADVGEYDDPSSFTSTLSREQYNEVRDFLHSHIASCPIQAGSQVISIESPVYGYDATADVVIASKPDMIFLDPDGTLVIREFKTTQKLPKDTAEAFDRFFATAWLLNLFGSGYRGPYESNSTRFELEVLTPEDSAVFQWNTSDAATTRMARSEVRRRSKEWHRDNVWAAAPGKHCNWCPVSRWCPERLRDEQGDHHEAHADEPSSGFPRETSD
ncbi:PD-(D/E)XK nuclease family protein [Streptomyces sp. NPDC014684]|uniref:PD-(D/E)XK nuclease family protein n=1 Tax=Streptomyces sp. NPDC014684 TaxID=3364880 RepID=UPI0036F9338D